MLSFVCITDSSYFRLKISIPNNPQVPYSVCIIATFYWGYNENSLYEKLAKELGCAFFIRKIDTEINDENEDIDGIEIPDIKITYDIKKSDKKTAVLLLIEDGKYKIISFLDNESIKKNNKMIITSDKLKEAFSELKNINDYVFISICEIKSNKEINDYVEEWHSE